ncbi:DUF7289 family protein [Halorientalis regularis]|jgi:hypothetical protein|uniref:Flagellin N-terminal-like domain-containing protein n=1 Tax=Halorientalis regularis TaxID=660518 RepID=A0A1G7F399_9EURY|nr:hypothetical protein [Halorientalis regularis]SDE70361.1 hypothetical protein SAMN05216218_1016 [Halorientalis regularis]
MIDRLTDRERAVSDLVAFILTFSIIISGTTIVYIGGVGALQDLRANEMVNSGERSMRGVAETLEDIHRKTVPGRSVELGVDGGQLNLVDSSMTYTFEMEGGGTTTESIRTNALVYRPSSEETRLVYEGGAVFREGRQSSIMTYPPVFDCSDDAALLSVPRLDGSISVSSGGNVELYGERDAANTGLYLPDGNPADVERVTVDISGTAVAESWAEYLEESGWEDEGSGEYTCEGESGGDLKSAYLRRTTIDLRTVL